MKSPGSAGAEAVSHLRVEGRRASERSAAVVLEDPLEIRLNGEPIAVTMRTPGDDIELGLGFLVTEGVIETPDAIAAAALCDDNPNVLEVHTTPGAAGVHRPEARNFYATSSCGVCGKASIDAVRVRAPGLHADDVRVDASVLAALPERLRGAQTLFRETGSVHAAGLFDAGGDLLCVREDVGRHNAVDKVVGWAALEERLPLRRHVLLVSGRAGFEIAQKALVAGIPILGAISGPSSLAVELTREGGMTLVAFLRGREMSVYSGSERIALA